MLRRLGYKLLHVKQKKIWKTRDIREFAFSEWELRVIIIRWQVSTFFDTRHLIISLLKKKKYAVISVQLS